MHVEPYLIFEGRCEEALELYRSALGAEVTMLMRHKDSPEPPAPGMLPPGGENKVLHASFRIGDTTVLASDGRSTGQPRFEGVPLAISVPDDAEAGRVFASLAAGGQVHQPLIKTFFSSSFGMVADRFGVSWMVWVVEPSATPVEAEIRELVESWRRALHAKDADAIVRHFAPDILAYDLAPPLLHRGADVYRQNLRDWFATFAGPVEYDVRDLSIETRDDLAISTSLNHIGGARSDGTNTDVWVRATIVYRKVDGGWRVAHEHLSVPFYMDGSFKAAVDLAP